MAEENRRLRNGVLLAIGIGCLLFAGYSMASFWGRPRGSDRDQFLLVCTKCGAESRVTSAELEQLPIDEATFASQCPACGELSAYQALLRCPKCKRAIPSTPGIRGTAFKCPYCQAPLGTRASPSD